MARRVVWARSHGQWSPYGIRGGQTRPLVIRIEVRKLELGFI